MHALLFRGRLRAEVRGHAVDLGEGHPFLLAERFITVVCQALDAWERGAALHVRAEAAVRCSSACASRRMARSRSPSVLPPLTPNGERGASTRSLPSRSPTSPLPPSRTAAPSLARSCGATAGRRRTCDSPPFVASSARPSDLLREAVQGRRSREPFTRVVPRLPPGHTRVRPAPHPGGSASLPQLRRPASATRSAGGRSCPGSTFAPRSCAATGSSSAPSAETFCLDRSTGEVLWRDSRPARDERGHARRHRATPRRTASSAVHDFGTGEVTLRSWLVPRTGGPPSGAVVHVPGLPRLLIVTEGEKHLVAIDLSSGEPRWRFAWGKKGTLAPQARGQAPLLHVGRQRAHRARRPLGRDRLASARSPALPGRARSLDHDTLFSVAGGVSSRAHLPSASTRSPGGCSGTASSRPTPTW